MDAIVSGDGVGIALFVSSGGCYGLTQDVNVESPCCAFVAASVGALLVQFRRGKHRPVDSSRHEDRAVIQQVRGLRLPRGGHAADG
jgi:hypothetical protein